MLRLAGVLLFICFAAGDQVVDIDSQVDYWLDFVNGLLSNQNLGLYEAPALSFPGVKVSNGVAVGANSLFRTAKSRAVVSADKRTFSVDVHVGQRLYVLAYGSIQTDSSDASGIVRVHNNSIHFAYTFSNSSSECDFRIRAYELEALSGAVYESSVSDEPTDVSEFFSQTVLPIVNGHLSRAIKPVEDSIRSKICAHRPSFNEHLPLLFTSMQELNVF